MPTIDQFWEWEGKEIFDANPAWKETGAFQSNLPSYDTMVGGDSMEILNELGGETGLVKRAWENNIAIQGRQMLQLGISEGFEMAQLEVIGQGLPEATKITTLAVIDFAQTAVMSGAMMVFDMVMETIGGIPVAGWAVDIAYGAGTAIAKGIAMGKEVGGSKHPLPAAARYNKAVDEDLTTSLMFSLETGPTTNWTPYFLPRGHREGEELLKYTHFCGLEHGGQMGLELEDRAYYRDQDNSPHVTGVVWKHKLAVPQSGYHSNVSSWGLVPGLCKVQWDWQVGKYDLTRTGKKSSWPAGDAKTLGHTPYNNTGDFAPTTRQALFSLWGRVTGNCGSSFKVDPEQLATRWEDAYGALRSYITFLAQRGRNNAEDRHIAYALTKMNMCAVHNMYDKPMQDDGQGRWPGPHLDFGGSTDDNFHRGRYTVLGDFFAGGYSGGGVQKGLHWALDGDPAEGLLITQPDLLLEYVMTAMEDQWYVPMPTWYGPSWVAPNQDQRYTGKEAKAVRKWDCEHPFAGTQEKAILYWPIVKMMIDNFRDMLHKDFVYKTTVAYVGPNFAAIQGNQALRDKWLEHRNLLLEHNARMTVDLSMIPDNEYRNAMAAAKKKGFTNLAPPIQGPDPSGPQTTVPGATQLYAPPSGSLTVPPIWAPPVISGSDVAHDETGRRITGAEKALIAAGLGGALWYLNRVGRKIA